MTAIAIFRRDDGVVIASDGAAYESATGRLVALTSKVMFAPEWSCVVAQRGAGGVLQMLRSTLAVEVFDFDHLLEEIELNARATHEHYLTKGYDDDARFTLFLAGFSETRQRFETYIVRTARHEARATEGEGVVVMEPYTLTPLPDFYLAPGVGEERMESFGITAAIAENDAVGAAVRAVCAARQCRNVEDEGAEYAVGGFVQLTMLQRDAVSSQIVHRWPDMMGQPIDPRCGAALPDWLRSNAETSTSKEAVAMAKKRTSTNLEEALRLAGGDFERLFDTWIVNGKPLGDCTVADLKEAVARKEASADLMRKIFPSAE